MEPPVGPESHFLQDEKAKVCAAMRPIDPRQVVRGQYVGYRDEPGVATRLDGRDVRRGAARDRLVAVGRRAVVRPCRQGALPQTATEAVVEFQSPPRLLFDEAGGPEPGRNLVRLRLGRRDGVTFTLQAKTPGPHLDSQPVDISVDFAAALGERREAYERLLGDAIAGSQRRFARQDVVEQTWRIVQPILDFPGPVHPYFRGSVGPRRSRSPARPRRPLVRPVQLTRSGGGLLFCLPQMSTRAV